MSVRREELSEVEAARQEELDRSWSTASDALADPEFRARLEQSIDRVNRSDSSVTRSKAEFLSATESTIE